MASSSTYGSNQRWIQLNRTHNFRDLGGYITADGSKETRWSRIYRSDSLSKLVKTEETLRVFRETLGIEFAVDLRSQSERIKEPYLLPYLETISIPIDPGNLTQLMRTTNLTEEVAVGCMNNLYERLITDFKDAYRTFFKTLVSKCKEAPSLVFHCTAGKDRTGLAAALLLLVLGVPVETVFEDYLMTNFTARTPPAIILQSFFGGRPYDQRAIESLFFVRRLYLQRSLEVIHESYGDVPSFVIHELGIPIEDIELLRTQYLVPRTGETYSV